ncbi:MAG: hypothetical protein ACREJD_03220 [Phycisphaerales bacterium]
MRWFEENLSQFGRTIDEAIEGVQARIRLGRSGPSIGSRVRDAQERATESVRHASSRVGEEVGQFVQSMKSDDRPAPRYVWPMMIGAVLLSAGLTFALTGSGTSLPPPTDSELKTQDELRREVARRRSPFESFVSQDRTAENAAAKKRK